jgi:hypothetical protein
MVTTLLPTSILGWVRTMILVVIGLLLIFAAPFVLSVLVLSKLYGRLREPPSEG